MNELCFLQYINRYIPFVFTIQGTMMYDVIGDGSAPSFFSVGNNGRIFTRGNLRSDNTLTYTVSFTKLMLLFNYTKTTFKFGETNSYHFV